LGWGIHSLHRAQSPCLIAAYYAVVLPHLLFGEGIDHLTPLNAVQKRILTLREVPLESYDRLVT
jgi:hypothetical protein